MSSKRPAIYHFQRYAAESEYGTKVPALSLSKPGGLIPPQVTWSEPPHVCAGPILWHSDHVECYGDHCRNLSEGFNLETIGRDHDKSSGDGCSRERADVLENEEDWA